MPYNIDDCPHFGCGDCKYFRSCKRVDGNSLQFARPWFLCETSWTHIPCKDFEHAHPEYADMKKWTNFDDFWNAYKKAWLPYENENIEIPFVVNDEKSVWYYVPLKKFLDGTMIENGKLLATKKKYYKRTREGFGYKLITEEIVGGVKLHK